MKLPMSRRDLMRAFGAAGVAAAIPVEAIANAPATPALPSLAHGMSCSILDAAGRVLGSTVDLKFEGVDWLADVKSDVDLFQKLLSSEPIKLSSGSMDVIEAGTAEKIRITWPNGFFKDVRLLYPNNVAKGNTMSVSPFEMMVQR